MIAQSVSVEMGYVDRLAQYTNVFLVNAKHRTNGEIVLQIVQSKKIRVSCVKAKN